MRILLADRTLVGQPHADWKEGWELCFAFRNLGHQADIAGPGCPIPHTEIVGISSNYDLIVVTENYPDFAWAGFDWLTEWAKIKTPKILWAIDTHLMALGIAYDYVELAKRGEFNWVACNNKKDMIRFGRPTFWLPYGTSRRTYGQNLVAEKAHNVVLVGSLTPDRLVYVNRYGMQHISAYGLDYVRALQSAKICFNKSKSYDINAKYFEITGSGSFMLSNDNADLRELVTIPELDAMLWKDDADLDVKIERYLRENDERERIAALVRKHVLENHAWENRAELILKSVGK